MIEILTRSIARAGGIEVSDDLQIAGSRVRKPSLWRRIANAFKQWEAKRSTYLALRALDDKTLRDIGISRNLIMEVSDDLARLAVANDNEPLPETECA